MAKTIDEILGTGQGTSLPRADTSAMEEELKNQLEAAKEQAAAKVDQSVAENVTALHDAQKEAEEGFTAQRAQIDLDEALAKDGQVLYAQLRGDRGGIGAAQYDSIANTAAENRLAVMQAQNKLAGETARKMAQLRAEGEFEKAEQLLELTQAYLGKLTDLQQWAAEYDLSAAKFAESISQWQQEYDQKQAQIETEKAQWAAEFDYETHQKDLKEAGETLLSMGILPSESQLNALGMTAQQAQSYMAAAKVQAAAKAAASSSKSSSAASSAASSTAKSGGEYALYLAAKESGGDPRTYVKNHYKEYGLTALPTEKAYENWEKSLQGAMSAGAFETFLRKLNVSLSEDSKAAVDYLTGKYWPGMTAAQRQKVEKLYADYGMQYFYGS